MQRGLKGEEGDGPAAIGHVSMQRGLKASGTHHTVSSSSSSLNAKRIESPSLTGPRILLRGPSQCKED